MRQFVTSLGTGGGAVVLPTPGNPVTLFDQSLATLPSGWTNNGFTDSGSGLVAAGTPSMDNSFYFNNQVWSYDLQLELSFTLTSLNAVIGLGGDMQNGRGNQSGLVIVDFAAGFLRYAINDDDGTYTVLYSTALTLTQSLTNYKLIVSWNKTVLTCRIELTSDSTDFTQLTHDSLSDYAGHGGIQGFTSVFNLANGFTCTNIKAVSLAPNNATIAFLGDSITEDGQNVTMPTTTIMDSFPRKVIADNNDLGLICAQSGGRTLELIDAANYLLPFYTNLQYVVVMIGINDRAARFNFLNNIDTLLNFIVAQGATPVLCTITPAPALQIYVDEMNAAIRTKGYDIIESAAAVGLGGDESVQNPAFMDDTVHPNAAGHLAIYNEIVANNSYLT